MKRILTTIGILSLAGLAAVYMYKHQTKKPQEKTQIPLSSIRPLWKQEVTHQSIEGSLKEQIGKINKKIRGNPDLAEKISLYKDRNIILEIENIGSYRFNIEDTVKLEASFPGVAERDVYGVMDANTWYGLTHGQFDFFDIMFKIKKQGFGISDAYQIYSAL